MSNLNVTPPKLNQVKIRRLWILIPALLIFGIIAVLSSFYTVREGEFAYVTRFGALRHVREQPGLYFRAPFVDDVNRLTRKQMLYDVKQSEVLTRDKKAMMVDSFAIWRIKDVTTFIRAVNNLSEMQKRIDASVYSVIKNLVGERDQSEIISDGRDLLNQEILQRVSDDLVGYGVEIGSVEIKRYDLPADNMAAVYQRMISDRAQIAAQYKAEGELEAARIRNDTDKAVQIQIALAEAEASRMKGEGEEEYMRILKELYSDQERADFYVFVRELDALKATMIGQKTLILGSDSPLTRILSGKTGLVEQP